MASKSIIKVLNQLSGREGSEHEGISELSPEEAEELAGGSLPDIHANGACGNKGCPTSNTSCG